MQVLIITEEEEFYLPLSIDYLLKTLGNDVAEIVCVKNVLLPSKLKAARKYFTAFGFGPVLCHGLRIIKAKFLDIFPWLNFSRRYYSVKRVCETYRVPYSKWASINAPEFIQHCKNLNINLIVSVSPTQIFKEELINLPACGCINVHTAKLPNYRGLYPTYWAMTCGEKTVGISVHYIEKKIDAGKIILQTEIEIPPHATLDYMLRITKVKGAELLVKVIKQIAEGTVKAFYPEGEGTYFSFPTSNSYKQFKSLGYRLW